MKKKIRHITVENTKFNWLVAPLNSQFVTVRVWLCGFSKLPWFNLKLPYRDPWLNMAEIIEESGGSHDFGNDSILQGVTPGKVAKMIKDVMLMIGEPVEIKKTLELEWHGEGAITKI